MCTTCGCGNSERDVKIYRPGQYETLENGIFRSGMPHSHEHTHTSAEQRVVEIERDILDSNNRLAERNRGYFEAKELVVFNLVSSPGSGKTTLLEETVRRLATEFPIYVIEGDQQSENDAHRIAALDVPVIQINTGEKCHLDAEMIHEAIVQLSPVTGGLVFIENVGNLVCPALFDLGEQFRVVIMSVTEGEDKPVKYPYMFRSSHMCLLNKVDLLPHLKFDREKARDYLTQANHHLKIMEVSALSGKGMEDWIGWIRNTITVPQS